MQLSKIFILLTIILALIAVPLEDNQQDASAQTESTITLWIDDGVPSDFQAILQPLLDTETYQWVNDSDEAQIIVSLNTDNFVINSHWVYVPVVPFASTVDNIRSIKLEFFWDGDPTAMTELTGTDENATLYITSEVHDALSQVWGPPSEDAPIVIVPEDALTTLLWENRPNSWSILPFHQLRPEFKALRVDDQNIFSENFDVDNYRLNFPIGVDGEATAIGQLTEDLLETGIWQATNRDMSQVSRVVLSGVTAMSRATAHKMETLGLTRPADGIMSFISDADILHTSNEVPFSVNCPPADPFLSTTIFCSDDRYIELLTHIGLDVVELTGNHINDYGPGAFRHSLEIYEENDIATFGGGLDPEDARDAFITEHNGNTVAFIGCNVPGPFKAWASSERAGAAQCDNEYLTEEIARLAQEVDVVIMTVQQWEFYRYSVGTEQLSQFTDYANLGADIVIGSQAHQPQGFTFIPRDNQTTSFLHHGLGNLFFDQMQNIGTRQMFLDKLIIYNGELISIVLYTGLIEDFCCPRPMTGAERIEFLNTIFAASGW